MLSYLARIGVREYTSLEGVIPSLSNGTKGKKNDHLRN